MKTISYLDARSAVTVVAAAMVLLLQACASGGATSTPAQSAAGTTVNAAGAPDVVKQPGEMATAEFPDPTTAWRKEGTFPLVDNLRLIRPGMTKDQLYELIGRPHFSERYGTEEWNYIFHFRVPGTSEVVTCQYKINFEYDKASEKKLAQQFAWAPAACAERLAPAPVPERVIERIVERPAPPPVPVKSRMTLGADGLFMFGKSELGDLNSEGRRKLDEMATKLKQPGVDVTSIVITGHTDRIGQESANLALSRARAETIKGYLVRKGVNPTLIRTVGVGKSEPIAQCPGAAVTPALIACLQPDRRVDVDVTVQQ